MGGGGRGDREVILSLKGNKHITITLTQKLHTYKKTKQASISISAFPSLPRSIPPLPPVPQSLLAISHSLSLTPLPVPRAPFTHPMHTSLKPWKMGTCQCGVG